jgi:acyl-CoA synthetase (NDP forming)
VALSHTSSLAGTDELYQALFDRLGIMRVGSITGLLETLKLLATVGPIGGPRLSVFTCSGGESALIADLAERAGLEFTPFSKEQADALRREMTVFTTIANPLDYNTAIWGDPPALERCFTTVMGGDYDVSVLLIDYPDPTHCDPAGWDASVDGFIAAHKATGCPAVVASTLPELLPASTRERVLANGLVPLQGLSETVEALGAAVDYGRRREALLADGNQAALALPAPGATPQDPAVLDEWRAKQILAACGLTVPKGRLTTATEAPRAAAEIGFPVVLKAVGANLAHKTEAGAVALGLESEEQVADAASRMRDNLSEAGREPGGFLVERMVTGAVAELIVGVKRDDSFGLALVVGSGGILVELARDSTALLLPTNRQAVVEALASLKAAKLLSGYRTGRKGDFEAAVDAVMTVAEYAEAHRDRLVELDVNPLLVLPAGAGVVAVDALIRMAD